MKIKNLTYENLNDNNLQKNPKSEIIYERDIDGSLMGTYEIPLRLEFLTFLYCKKGGLTFYVNTKEVTLTAHDLFINIPQNILKTVQVLPETCCDILIISLDFINEMNLFPPNMPAYAYLREAPILNLDVEEQKMIGILSYMNELICEEENDSDMMRKLLTGIFLCKLKNAVQKRLDQAPVHVLQPHSRQEELFREFLGKLASNHKEQRSITFYANELNVTPKYFSTVIKKVSGRSPVDWINDSVIREAKTMLRFSNMTVQEIAYALNFSSQTFFGKYFKRLTGITPGEFRTQKSE